LFYMHFIALYAKHNIASVQYYNRNSPMRRVPTRTVEIVDEKLDDVVDHDATSRGLSFVGLASKVRSKSKGYIDTIVNFNDDGTDLKIANIVRIGDKYITKEWQCGDNWEKKYGNRNIEERLESPLKDVYDTATGHMHSQTRSNRSLGRNSFVESVEANPTFRDIQRHRDNMELTVLHEGCDL